MWLLVWSLSEMEDFCVFMLRFIKLYIFVYLKKAKIVIDQ